MFKTIIKSVLFLSLLAFLGCNENEEASNQDIDESAEMATEQMTAVMQSLDSESYASVLSAENNKVYAYRNSILSLINTSFAAGNCHDSGAVYDDSCSGSGPYVNTRSYNSCTLGNQGFLVLNGSATYSFSDSSCSMIGFTNRSVTREIDLTLSGKSGGELIVSSETHQDYRGNSIGGGQRLSVDLIAGNYSYEVLGLKRALVSPGGSDIFNFSSRTTTAFNVTGSSLNDLVINSGELEIINNKKQNVVTLAASNVSFSSSCLCPVSGTLSGSYQGSTSGSLQISYSSCGEAVVTKGDGSQYNVSFDGCSVP